jgi:hypothetical protein
MLSCSNVLQDLARGAEHGRKVAVHALSQLIRGPALDHLAVIQDEHLCVRACVCVCVCVCVCRRVFGRRGTRSQSSTVCMRCATTMTVAALKASAVRSTCWICASVA